LQGSGVPDRLARRVAAFGPSRDALPIASVAEHTHTDVDEVARVHFALAARLRLDWLRDRIAELPRADRWQIEARAALRDDVADLQCSLTEAVLASTDRGADPVDRIEQWVGEHADVVHRYVAVLADIEVVATFDLATLGAARRELRGLVDVIAR
jgi:glutamate dehydrogenase